MLPSHVDFDGALLGSEQTNVPFTKRLSGHKQSEREARGGEGGHPVGAHPETAKKRVGGILVLLYDTVKFLFYYFLSKEKR